MGGKSRQTPQKKKIFEILCAAPVPLTAEQVWDCAREQFPRLALTTVYRNMEALVAAGVVHATVFDDGAKRYALAERHQHFLTCVKCKRSVEIPACPFETLKEELARDTGFSISGHRMEFFGMCPACREKRDQ